jgi:hypothetical protein
MLESSFTSCALTLFKLPNIHRPLSTERQVGQRPGSGYTKRGRARELPAYCLHDLYLAGGQWGQWSDYTYLANFERNSYLYHSTRHKVTKRLNSVTPPKTNKRFYPLDRTDANLYKWPILGSFMQTN